MLTAFGSVQAAKEKPRFAAMQPGLFILCDLRFQNKYHAYDLSLTTFDLLLTTSAYSFPLILLSSQAMKSKYSNALLSYGSLTILSSSSFSPLNEDISSFPSTAAGSFFLRNRRTQSSNLNRR